MTSAPSTPPAEPNPATTSGSALWSLLAVNLLTLIMALWQGWGLLHLLWPYWIQSMVVAWYARRKVIDLAQQLPAILETEQLPPDDDEISPKSLRRRARSFTLFFGVFHLAYLAILAKLTLDTDPVTGLLPVMNANTGELMQVYLGVIDRLDWLLFALLGVGFWQSEAQGRREQLDRPAAISRRVNHTLGMATGRILPVHAGLIIGMMLTAGQAIALFIGLKTALDLGLHWLDQRPASATDTQKS